MTTPAQRKSLLQLKARVMAALKAKTVPQETIQTLAELNGNRVRARWKGSPRVEIDGGSHGSIAYGSAIQEALESAGLRVRYGLYSPPTEGRYVVSTNHSYISIPLNQEKGPWGYDCA